MTFQTFPGSWGAVLPAVPVTILSCLIHYTSVIYCITGKYKLTRLQVASFCQKIRSRPGVFCFIYLQVIDSIYKGMDNNLLTGAIYLDLRKAFGTVNHHILLSKFKRLNPTRNTFLVCFPCMFPWLLDSMVLDSMVLESNYNYNWCPTKFKPWTTLVPFIYE